eukprot:UN28471
MGDSVGMINIIFGSVLDFLALGFGRQCVIAPLGSFTLVSNVILSIPMQNERPSRPILYSTALIIIGSSVAVAFGGEEETVSNIDEVFELYRTSRFWIYSVCMTASLFYFGCFYST